MIGVDSLTVRLVTAGLALALASMVSGAARAAPAPAAAATAPHTVTWYANNRAARARQQLACLDDPGRLHNTPDCINAESASATVALRETRHQIGELDARKPAFWSEDPKNRYNKLLICRRNPQLTNCDVARRSLELEANGR